MSDPKTFTRTSIQIAISKPVAEALSSLGVPNDPDHLRRICRALATVGMTGLLDDGASPQYVAGQLLEALGHELERRKKAAGATGFLSVVPPPTAEA